MIVNNEALKLSITRAHWNSVFLLDCNEDDVDFEIAFAVPKHTKSIIGYLPDDIVAAILIRYPMYLTHVYKIKGDGASAFIWDNGLIPHLVRTSYNFLAVNFKGEHRKEVLKEIIRLNPEMIEQLSVEIDDDIMEVIATYAPSYLTRLRCPMHIITLAVKENPREMEANPSIVQNSLADSDKDSESFSEFVCEVARTFRNPLKYFEKTGIELKIPAAYDIMLDRFPEQASELVTKSYVNRVSTPKIQEAAMGTKYKWK